MSTVELEGIPVLWREPTGPPSGIALWLTHLGGAAERCVPMLERLAEAGYVGISFDPPGHGVRGAGDPWEYATAVLSSFRRRMWPLLGQTTVDCLRVLDWAASRWEDAPRFVAGGVSIGGDVAVALAGVDARISRVAAIGSTPDWSRPDMRELANSTRVLDQGMADSAAQWWADQLDPTRHLERYQGGTAIAFELGEDDRHIPLAHARAFAAALDEAGGASSVRVRSHPGLDHLGVTTSEAALGSALAWLLEEGEELG